MKKINTLLIALLSVIIISCDKDDNNSGSNAGANTLNGVTFDFTQVGLDFVPGWFGNNDSYIISLYSEELNWEEGTGEGAFFRGVVYTETEELPSGVYPFDVTQEPGTLYAGGFYENYNIANPDPNGTVYAISGGSVTIENTETSFHITFSVSLIGSDAGEHSFGGSYTIEKPEPPVNENIITVGEDVFEFTNCVSYNTAAIEDMYVYSVYLTNEEGEQFSADFYDFDDGTYDFDNPANMFDAVSGTFSDAKFKSNGEVLYEATGGTITVSKSGSEITMQFNLDVTSATGVATTATGKYVGDYSEE